MFKLILILALGLVTVVAVLLQKTYGHVPAKELKRRAQSDEANAQALYRVVAYGVSLRIFLWIVIAFSAASVFYAVSHALPLPLALLAIIGLFGLGFAWLPNTKVSRVSQWLAEWLALPLAWLLNYLNTPLQAVGALARNHSSLSSHTNLFQKEDFIELLEQQERQSDNRITKQEIDMAVHALSFGQKLVRDIFIPFNQVKSVKLNDSIGPVLMDELHESGHSRFPVYEGKTNNIVGVLYLHDLVQKQHGGSVKDIYQKHVVYAHEEQDLYQTLQAFLKTKRHLFIVVNRFEEVIGIVTIEDVLEQVIGQPIVDEFDQYDDLRAIASRQAAKIHKQQKHSTPEAEPISEPATAEQSE